MVQIVDVGPTGSNSDTSDYNQSVTGRMLSIACSDDGRAVYTGSYSNLWASIDGGQNFEQVTWPQPDPGRFDVPGALGGWCVVDIAVAAGWQVENHPRLLAPLTASGFADIVGFGDSGVWTALSAGDGSFQASKVVVANFGFQAGGWRVDRHPRFAVDLTGDGLADLIGFDDAGVWTALSNGDGTFQEPNFVLENFGTQQGWRVERHPRFVASLTRGGYAGLVGFGDAGVWTALGNGDGTFQPAHLGLSDLGYRQGWRVDRHPRSMAMLTDGGDADIVAFGDLGVWTALGNGDGTFQGVRPALAEFGYRQGWRVGRHPRVAAPLALGGQADIVAFGDAGVRTARANGDGTFQASAPALDNFGYQQGWRVGGHPRFVADLTGDGLAAIVGFGDAGVWTARGNGDGTFQGATFVLANFGQDAGGWRVGRHPRLVANLTNSGHADVVAFGDAGVWTALGDGQGGFPVATFVLANFGYGSTVLAITINDLAADSRGVWRSTDDGANWTRAHRFPMGETAGQLQWALGSDHLVYAAGGSSLAISKDGGATFEDVFPWGAGPSARVNHVAVWQNAPADPFPAVIYALGESTMYLSFDGGGEWIEDTAAMPTDVGAPVGSTGNTNAPSVMVISPRWPLEVYVAENPSSDPKLWRGDYSQFPFGTRQSSWEEVVGPDNLAQDNGNVFLATTRKGQGDLLFYGARGYDGLVAPFCHVGPLYPSSASDWTALDTRVHLDLHGILLSPEFAAVIENGDYRHRAGTLWLLSDGGVHRSTDGGMNFQPANGVRSLSCVNVAGVAMLGRGPAISLNTGDNDGFYSLDGGQSWAFQQYGGGDNDCSYADPFRPHAILVQTPRWDTAAHLGEVAVGCTVSVYESGSGGLPDARRSRFDRRAVTGPPLAHPSPPRHPWNALGDYTLRGSRPIVLGLPGEDAPAQGDYVFILFHSQRRSVLVRTQNIIDIAHRFEWLTSATGPGQGANVFQQGPDLPDRLASSVQASGGHVNPVFYVGRSLGPYSPFGLWSWTEGQSDWTRRAPGPGATNAVRFFVDPYRPNLLYILSTDHVRRSDDGGASWTVDVSLHEQLSWGGRIAISSDEDSSGVGDHLDLVLTDMQFDPFDPCRRFAVGLGGVFTTSDGVNWTRLLHTGALAGRPANSYYDWVSDPSDPALYVAFAGRSLVKITQFDAVVV